MLKYNNRTLTYNNRWLNETMIPIDLPPNTVRLRYADGVILSADSRFPDVTLTQISSIPNIWDLTNTDNNWWRLLSDYTGYGSGLLEIIGANVSGVDSLTGLCYGCKSLYKVCNLNLTGVFAVTAMFGGCINLTQVGSINMSGVQLMNDMFNGCKQLPVIPNITLPSYKSDNNCYQMFYACYKVSSGITNLYNRLRYVIDTSSVGNYLSCFHDCGRDSPTGSAELAQIPVKWK